MNELYEWKENKSKQEQRNAFVCKNVWIDFRNKLNQLFAGNDGEKNFFIR